MFQYHPDKKDCIYQFGLLASKAMSFVITAGFHLEICEVHFILTHGRKN